MVRTIFLFTVSFKGRTEDFQYIEESEQRAFTHENLGWQWAKREFDLSRPVIKVKIDQVQLEGK